MGFTGKYLAIALLLYAPSLNAQKLRYDVDALPNAPSETMASLAVAGSDSLESTNVPEAPSLLLAAAVHRPTLRVVDKHFWFVNGYDLFWTVADVEITAAGMRADLTCHEYNPLVSRRPSRAALYASNLPVIVGAAYLSYRAKKKNSGKWYWAPALAGSLHAGAFLWDATGSTCLK